MLRGRLRWGNVVLHGGPNAGRPKSEKLDAPVTTAVMLFSWGAPERRLGWRRLYLRVGNIDAQSWLMDFLPEQRHRRFQTYLQRSVYNAIFSVDFLSLKPPFARILRYVAIYPIPYGGTDLHSPAPNGAVKRGDSHNHNIRIWKFAF